MPGKATKENRGIQREHETKKPDDQSVDRNAPEAVQILSSVFSDHQNEIFLFLFLGCLYKGHQAIHEAIFLLVLFTPFIYKKGDRLTVILIQQEAGFRC
jgi:hypothetical protein